MNHRIAMDNITHTQGCKTLLCSVHPAVHVYRPYLGKGPEKFRSPCQSMFFFLKFIFPKFKISENMVA